MRTALEFFAAQKERNLRTQFVKRAMWLDLEERVRATFAPILAAPAANSFGGFFLRNALELNEAKLIDYSTTRMNITNSIYLFTGSSGPDVLKTFGKDSFTWVSENGATLWFTQSAAGGVCVFVSPYKSELHYFKRPQLWLAYYGSPHQVSVARIKRHGSQFLRYCVLTSYTSPPSLVSALHLKWRNLLDLKYRALESGRLWAHSRKLLGVLLVAVAGAALKAWQEK